MAFFRAFFSIFFFNSFPLFPFIVCLFLSGTSGSPHIPFTCGAYYVWFWDSINSENIISDFGRWMEIFGQGYIFTWGRVIRIGDEEHIGCTRYKGS